MSSPRSARHHDLLDHAEILFQALVQMPLDEKVETLNALRQLLHRYSPFAEEPVDCLQWIPADQVHGNDYNPNTIAPPEMRLLKHSIQMDGYTQPIVAHAENGTFEVVDGFHRQKIGKDVPAIRRRLQGYLPIVSIRANRSDLNNRIAATIRHNRARGVHALPPMITVVRTLLEAAWNDAQVAQELGMEPDEVFRFMQFSGLPHLFRDQPFSTAWE